MNKSLSIQSLYLLFSVLLNFGCSSKNIVIDNVNWPESTEWSSDSELFSLHKEILHKCEKADFYSQYVYLKFLLSEIKLIDSSLREVLSSPAYSPREKELSAYLLWKGARSASLDALAKYYVNRLEDPEYDIFDYMVAFDAHRHGGFTGYKNKRGKLVVYQYSCPMDEINTIGKPALKYLLPQLGSHNERVRVLSFDCIRKITTINIPHDLSFTDYEDVTKILKEKGWIE